MSSRRSRFTCLIHRQGITPKRSVVLAYSAAGAADYFRSQGYTVLSVAKGDHRVEARKAAIKSSGGFTIDRAVLREAIKMLDLKLPVHIRYSSKVGNTNGNYRFTGTSHDIMLKAYHTPAQASSTLWHELTHAMQAERAGSTLAWAQEREKCRGLYKKSPIEIEARAMSRRMSDFALAR